MHLLQAQATLNKSEADKLKLQEELEAAKRALESGGNEKQELQGTLDRAQQAASVPDPAIGTGDVPAVTWEGGAVRGSGGLNRAQANKFLHFLAISSALPYIAQLLQAQAALNTSEADKLKLQEELEAAKRALESSGNEKQELQGTLDLAQQAASVPDPAIGTGDVPAVTWEGGAVRGSGGLNRAKANKFLHFLAISSALPYIAQLLQAQADKLKLQEELEAAKRALESIRKENRDWQAKLDIALGLGLEVYVGTIYMMCYHGNLSPIRNDRGCQNARILVYVRLVFG